MDIDVLLARTLLLPLLGAQALYVAKTARRLPEATGPRAGTRGSGPALRLLVLGDSSAAGVGVAHQKDALTGQLLDRLSPHFRISWRLNARTGATTTTTLARLAAAPAFACDAAVIALGVNDTTHGTTLRNWMAHQRQLLDRLEQDHGARRIYVSGLPPLGAFPLLPQPLRWAVGRQAQRFDTALRALIGARPACRHIALDFPMDPTLMAEDGFHPGPHIYRAWADRVSARIIDDFAAAAKGDRAHANLT